MSSIIKKFENTKSFTEHEAWKLFKIAAFAEAFGWTCLIIGLLVSHYGLVNRDVALPIAGQIHGMLFIGYFLVLFFIYPSLNWKRTTIILGLIAGVIPYGSIVFEIILNHYRTTSKMMNNKVFILIQSNDQVIAVQPINGIEWQLPNIDVRMEQSSIKAAQELLKLMFGVEAQLIEKDKIIKGSIEHTYYQVIKSETFFKLNLFNISKYLPFIDEIEVKNISELHLPLE